MNDWRDAAFEARAEASNSARIVAALISYSPSPRYRFHSFSPRFIHSLTHLTHSLIELVHSFFPPSFFHVGLRQKRRYSIFRLLLIIYIFRSPVLRIRGGSLHGLLLVLGASVNVVARYTDAAESRRDARSRL